MALLMQTRCFDFPVVCIMKGASNPKTASVNWPEGASLQHLLQWSDGGKLVLGSRVSPPRKNIADRYRVLGYLSASHYFAQEYGVL